MISQTLETRIASLGGGVLAAAAFLTRVPVPHRASPPNLARAYRAFPVLGAAIGAAELWPIHDFSAFRSWVAFPAWRD